MKPRYDLRDFGGARPRFSMCLLHGGDADLIDQRTAELTVTVAESLKDPFRVATLAIEDHGQLASECTAGSMGGGRRVVRVRDAGDRLLPALQRLGASPAGDALVILAAGALTPRSKLRAWAEANDGVASIQCNSDDPAQRRSFIAATIKRSGASASPDMLGLLQDRLPTGRRGIEAELEKLILLSQGSELSMDDAHTLFDAGSAATVQAALDAALFGDVAPALTAWELAYEAGASGVGAVRVLASELSRVSAICADVGTGVSVPAALERHRIYPRDPRARSWRRTVERWQTNAITHAFALVQAAETACKTTGLSERLVVAELLTALAQPVPSAQERQ